MEDYIPGYNWIPGRFGPPPGIPKEVKEKFDKMEDGTVYFDKFLNLRQDQKESLMVSEVERIRSFSSRWPIEELITGGECAAQGFYFTGDKDIIQCAFCGGRLGGWRKGHSVAERHKEDFPMCSIVQELLWLNISLPPSTDPPDLLTELYASPNNPGLDNQESVRQSYEESPTAHQPKHPQQRNRTSRMETFTSFNYADSNHSNISIGIMCDAGFFYEGNNDHFRCHWCDGELKSWKEGDNPWEEHAKWYPGCVFLGQVCGIEFIKEQRGKMEPDQLNEAGKLVYNRFDLSFLEDNVTIQSHRDFPQRFLYQFCVLLEYDREHIRQAYEANNGEEFQEPAMLVEIVQCLAEGDDAALEAFRLEVRANAERATVGLPIQQPQRRRAGDVLIRERLTEDNMWEIMELRLCVRCNTKPRAVVCLPCGHLTHCETCFPSPEAARCPECNIPIKDRVTITGQN